MNWLPIESAPKDGTCLLLYDPAGVTDELGDPTHVVCGRWITSRRSGCSYWCVSYLQGGYDVVVAEPTHWMPLPEKP